MLPCQFSNKKHFISSAFFTINVRVQSWFWGCKSKMDSIWMSENTKRDAGDKLNSPPQRLGWKLQNYWRAEAERDIWKKKKKLFVSRLLTRVSHKPARGKANQHSSGSDTAWLKGKSHSGHFILFSCALGRRRGHLIMFYLPRGHSRGEGFLFFFNLNQYEGLVEKNNIKKG